MRVKKFIFASIMAQTGIKIASKVAEKPFTSPHHQQNCKFHVADARLCRFDTSKNFSHPTSCAYGRRRYAFDSTTIPLCLSTFPWARFRRKKGGVKAHVLYDVEAQVPAFYTVTTASKHNSTVILIKYLTRQIFYWTLM